MHFTNITGEPIVSLCRCSKGTAGCNKTSASNDAGKLTKLTVKQAAQRARNLKQTRSGLKHVHKGIGLSAHNIMRRTNAGGVVPLEIVQAVIGIKTVIAAEVEQTGEMVARWLRCLWRLPIVEEFCESLLLAADASVRARVVQGFVTCELVFG